MESDLSLTYTFGGFDITSISSFGGTGLTGQSFTVKGAFGPFSISGKMRFDPTATPPIYQRSQLVSSFEFGGVTIGLTVNHWLAGQWDGPYFGYPATTADPCPGQTPGTVGNLQYVYTLGIAPWSVRVRYLDCCAGTFFQDLRVIVSPIELCCGIKLKGTLDFTKLGFYSLSFTGIDIPLCCGVSLDVSITYGVDYKSVTVTPKFAGFAEACFTVWGGAVEGTTRNIWEGIRIDGFRIRCTIADCNYLEYVHAFLPIQTTIPAAIRDKFLAGCRENEYLELGFCGPGCCGGKYEVTLRIMWSTATPPQGGLFGVTRFVGSAKVPVMVNFTLNLDFVMPVAACATPSFCLGWTFTF